MRPLIAMILSLTFISAIAQEFPLPTAPREPVYDTAPQFPGGSDAMMRYFADSIRYPGPERTHQKEGPVMVAFTVTRKGAIAGVRIVNGVPGAPNLAAEARRVLEGMPRWIPATKGRKRVEAEVHLSIPFWISGAER